MVCVTGWESGLVTYVCISFVDLSLTGAFKLQRTKTLFPIVAGFHLVDALSWLQSWTGAVSYKMYALVPTSFFAKAAVGRRGRDS